MARLKSHCSGYSSFGSCAVRLFSVRLQFIVLCSIYCKTANETNIIFTTFTAVSPITTAVVNTLQVLSVSMVLLYYHHSYHTDGNTAKFSPLLQYILWLAWYDQVSNYITLYLLLLLQYYHYSVKYTVTSPRFQWYYHITIVFTTTVVTMVLSSSPSPSHSLARWL